VYDRHAAWTRKRREVEKHIDECDSCRQLVAALGASSSIITPYAGTLEPATRNPDADAGAGAEPTLTAGDIVGNRYATITWT
jgi:hypothetical protein